MLQSANRTPHANYIRSNTGNPTMPVGYWVAFLQTRLPGVAQFCTELSMQIAGSFQSLLQKELL